jgi:hypothetical protein
MLNLGQASCLVMGYRPNNPEEREKAKVCLQKCGLIAAYLRGNDPFRPMAISVEVLERDPYTYLSYPDSSRNNDDSGNDSNNDDGDDDSNNDDGGDDSNNDDGNSNSSGDKDSSDEEDANSDSGEASYQTNAGQKRSYNGEVMPFCKDRLLRLISTIASHEDPHNDDCYVEQFVTGEKQFEMMKQVFPRFESYCSMNKLQQWITKAGIWGTTCRRKINGVKVSGRNLWIVKEEYQGNPILTISTD